jgi:hypothetical protein
MDCGIGSKGVSEIESNWYTSLDYLSTYFERKAIETKSKIKSKPQKPLLSPLEKKHRKRLAEVRWHKSHPRNLAEANKRWRQRNPDKVRVLNQRYQKKLKERKSNLTN